MIVRTDKPTRHRVIVSALEIIETAFAVKIIPTITERVLNRKRRIVRDFGSVCVKDMKRVAPCVIHISCIKRAVFVPQLVNVSAAVANNIDSVAASVNGSETFGGMCTPTVIGRVGIIGVR